MEKAPLRKKLTKDFLFALPDGALLVGNCRPVWWGYLDGKTDRNLIWESAKFSGANGRLVDVVWTMTEFEEMLHKHGHARASQESPRKAKNALPAKS